jgi:hypothetical protein
MHPIRELGQMMTRRHFFGAGARLGLGAAALATLDDRPINAGSIFHHAPRAKRAIYLFMNGGPSQLDLWDHKPRLASLHDQELPASVLGDQLLTLMTVNNERFPIAASKFRFARHGRSGIPVSELLPATARVVDDLCVVNTMHTEEVNHDPAVTYICTGQPLPGRPSLGAWISYGLGSLSENLPTFVVMSTRPARNRNDQSLYSRMWGAGFLPSKHQGVALRGEGDPILFLNNPEGVDAAARRRMLDGLSELNERHLEETGDPETRARVAQYEMAFKLQSSVPELMDLSRERKEVIESYGPEVHHRGSFASSCLLARRMLERGTRFAQIFSRGWDHHIEVPRPLAIQCEDIDRPCAALIADLKQRGMLEDTLVIWGGEFGRTTYCQGSLTATNYGRDHHRGCFTMWLAGGGVKAGHVHGLTDDFGFNIVNDPVHVLDLNATILHCLGLDHRRVVFRHQGVDTRPTGVEERHVVHELLA